MSEMSDRPESRYESTDLQSSVLGSLLFTESDGVKTDAKILNLRNPTTSLTQRSIYGKNEHFYMAVIRGRVHPSVRPSHVIFKQKKTSFPEFQ